ncbi:MAG: leucyl aminopeptidase [Pseudomonadota bacterium]
MALLPEITFAAEAMPTGGTLVVFAGDQMALGPAATRVNGAADGLITRAAEAHGFKGKRFATLSLPLPAGLDVDTLLVVGFGEEGVAETDEVKLGGAAMGALPQGPNTAVTVFCEGSTEDAVALATGMRLRAYSFDDYKTKKGEEPKEARKITICCADPDAATAAWAGAKGIADGVILARQLVNLPPNDLGPVEFAERAEGLRDLGCDVTILDENDLRAADMRAMLGVAQGSVRPARLAIMEWKGGAEGDAPLAFVGKGVVFDTGGISIKPAGGMEDMKGDMGGAAAVIGLMHALSARKAKVNAIGVLGLVENMPDGNAQRPGDIVRSRSGQTIEIINTDAEGRLVLADCLTYTIDTYKPKMVIDLATLTGAIIVALGHVHAGMYTDDDGVAERLVIAGKATGDTVWRMPLGKDYDNLIDSKFADMKNTGGRWGGSITAAQFLKRFAQDQTWVHLDVAGTAMGAPTNEISRTFGSGYGVRLLDRFVSDNFED